MLRLKVKGRSMTPFIKDCDIVTLSRISNPAAQIGEAIAFICPCSRRFVIHRVIKKTRDGYIVKGDNVPSPDGFIPEGNVLGVVTRVERNGGKVISGSGPGMKTVAFFSRTGLLPVIFGLWRALPSPIRQFIKWKTRL